MKTRSWRWCGGLGLGLAFGWLLADGRGALRADGADRVEGSVLATGRVEMQQHPSLKTNTPQDAIYYLDYKKGRLLAAVPSYRQVGNRVSVLGEFGSRDLVADFQLQPGITPHFALTVADLGVSNPGEGLFVIETTTGRIATYVAELRGAGPQGERAPKLDLVEIRNLP